MDGRERSRPDDEREQRAAEAPTAPAHPLLELQRGAGNRAVSAMLARAPDAKPKDKETPKKAAPSGHRATLPDIGTIPLLSVQLSGGGQPGRGRDREEGKPATGDIVVTSRHGEHSALLFRAAIDGKPMTVEIVLAGGGSNIVLTLKGAIIAGYSTSGGGDEAIESWSLSFASMEQNVTETP